MRAAAVGRLSMPERAASAAPAASSNGPPFGAMLDAQVTRTAVAEGQQSAGARSAGHEPSSAGVRSAGHEPSSAGADSRSPGTPSPGVRAADGGGSVAPRGDRPPTAPHGAGAGRREAGARASEGPATHEHRHAGDKRTATATADGPTGAVLPSASAGIEQAAQALAPVSVPAAAGGDGVPTDPAAPATLIAATAPASDTPAGTAAAGPAASPALVAATAVAATPELSSAAAAAAVSAPAAGEDARAVTDAPASIPARAGGDAGSGADAVARAGGGASAVTRAPAGRSGERGASGERREGAAHGERLVAAIRDAANAAHAAAQPVSAPSGRDPRGAHPGARTGDGGAAVSTRTGVEGTSGESRGPDGAVAAIDRASSAPRASAAPASAPSAPSAGRAVALPYAPDTVRLTLQTAASSGASLARIRLSPATLGDIHIQLQQTTGGVIARVLADHPATVHTLQQAGAELRRALEGTGTTLLALDIGASGQERDGRAADPGSTGPGSTPRGPSRDGAAAPATPVQAPRTVTLGNGALIDILA